MRPPGRLETALILALVLTACTRETPPPDPPPTGTGETLPQQELRGVVMRQVTDRGLQWVLHSDRGQTANSTDPVQLERLRVDCFDGQDSVRSTLTSKRGEIDSRATTLLAQDSVVVVTSEGDRLETDVLRWDPVRQRVTTQSFFRFYHGKDYITGTGFDADPDLKSYVIEKNLVITLRGTDPAALLEEEETR